MRRSVQITVRNSPPNAITIVLEVRKFGYQRRAVLILAYVYLVKMIMSLLHRVNYYQTLQHATLLDSKKLTHSSQGQPGPDSLCCCCGWLMFPSWVAMIGRFRPLSQGFLEPDPW
jgi:hypothetical protein